MAKEKKGESLSKWESLSLSDDFIFQKVMLKESLCKKILSEILGVEVTKIKYTEYEKTITIRSDAKSIRLDVYIRGEDSIYSIEMQKINRDDLKKRSRYYHDLIDLDLLESGCRYKNLNNAFVIFICDFDLFGKGQYRYTFTSMCEEVKNLPLNEGRTTIFMNANGYCGNVSEDCKLFLQAVKSEFTDEPFSAILKSEVERVKSSVEWRTEYMRLSEWIEDEIEMGIEEGIEKRMEQYKEEYQKEYQEGLQEGLQEGELRAITSLVCKKLAKGQTYVQIAEMLEEDMEMISKIGDIAKNTEPPYDVDKVLEKLLADK